MLEISHVTVEVEGKEVIKDLSLSIGNGECHAIMGPNGAGKSTLAKVLAGDPSYEVTGGEISFLGQDLLALEIEERAALGLLLSFQYPIEIAGVSNHDFLYKAFTSLQQSRKQTALSKEKFENFLLEKAHEMGMDISFLQRNVNEGFSGGEKKKNEMLQLAVLGYSLAILDETDSGLDIDSLKMVAEAVNRMRSKDRSHLIITHYQRLLDYVQPDKVHVMIDGTIVKTGGPELAHELEEKGYDWLMQVR